MTGRSELEEDPAFARLLLDAGRAEPLPTERTSAALAKFAAGLTALQGAELQALTASSSGAREWWSAKWLALSALVGSAATYIWLQGSAPLVESSSSSRASEVSVVVVDPAVVPPLPVPSAVTSQAAPRAVKPPTPVRSAAKASPDLAAEIAALDAIRTALNIGGWEEAERELARYRRTFPKGALRNEAEVLGIRSLSAQGRRADAARAARAFLAQHPRDPQASALRALLE